MSCTIKFNNDGKINTVLKPDGTESRLFSQISKLPHVGSLEEALEIFKNVYTKEAGIYNTKGVASLQEPTLSFKSDKGELYNNYKEALQNSTGGDIETGIYTNEGFLVLQTVSSNTNPSTYNGFINQSISEGLLSDEKIIENGESFHKAAGNDPAFQMANEQILKEDAISSLNKKNVKIYRDGRIELKDEKNTVVIDGVPVSLEEIRNSNRRQLEQKFGADTALNLTINKAVSEAMPNGIGMQEPLPKESDLKIKLLDLLNSMGVSVMSINEYIKKYQIRNGVEPSAEALVDISRQVVAFKDGEISTEDLTEETIHFIVEAWDNAEIENLLRNVHKTKNFQEHSERYREIYTRENPEMNPEQIDNLVRREILGKELSEALKNRFNTEGKTEIQANIIRRLYDMFIKFFQDVVFSDSYKKDLENLSVKISDLLLSQDVNKYLNIEQTKSKKFRMYSTQPSSGDLNIDNKSAITKQLVLALLEQEKNLRKAGRGSSTNMRMLTEAMDKALTKSSALELLKLAKRQAGYVSVAIDKANQKGETLSNEEAIVFDSLKENIKPLIERLGVLSKTDADIQDLREDFEKVLQEISDVSGKVQNIENKIFDRIVDRLMVRHNLDAADRDRLQQAVTNAMNDTSQFYAWFGQITHAHDPLLNILGSVISDMDRDASQRYMNRAKEFQKILRSHGFDEKVMPKFMDENGYILSIYDWSKFEEDVANIKAQAFIDVTGSTKTLEEIKKQMSEGTLEKITDPEKNKEYSNITNTQINAKIERTFNDEYYKERDKKYDDLGISDSTRRWLRTLSTDLGKIISRTKTEKGLPRFSLEDKHNLNGINLQRRGLKSLTDDMGNYKKGIEEVPSEIPGETIEVNGKYYTLNTSLPERDREEATVAFEINKLDKLFMDEKKEEAAKAGQKIDVERLAPKFLEELKLIEEDKENGGREAALEFFLLNTSVGFSNDFWANYDNSENLMSVIDRYLTDPNAEQYMINDINEYKRMLDKRKSILKQYQDSRNFTNTIADEMTESTKALVRDLSENIDIMYQRLMGKFGEQLPQTDVNQEKPYESTPNQAYYEALQDEGIENDSKKRFDYALKHMTADNAKRVRAFGETLSDFIKGKFVTDNQKLLIQRVSGLTDLNDLVTEDIERLKLEYAETKLAPYFRAFAPAGLNEFYKNLRESQASIYDLVSRMNASREDVKMSNNFSYYEVADLKGKNENYKEDFEGGNKQPRLSQYLNPRFVQMFNPVLDSNNNPVLDKDGKMKVKSNQKLYDLYHDYIQFQKETLRSYGELGDHNVYIAPQISKTQLERINTTLRGKKGSLKDWWTDITRFRMDEQVFGEEMEGESLIRKSGLRIIPKYFLKKFPDSGMISTDLFYSSMMMAQQAELYKAKKERYSEFATLHDKVLNRTYPNGKLASASNTYKMFKSYMDYNLFGVKEIRNWRVTLPFLGQIDLTKVINWLHGWLRNNSLALNVVIPMTSWITAESTLFIEKLIGQYVDKSSYSLGMREFRRLSTPAMSEGLEVNSTSALSIMGEYYGAFDLKGRFENSMYNKAGRTFGKAMYGLHTMGNFTPLSNAMLSQLFGHRVYNGKLVDFSRFEKIYKATNQGADNKTIDVQWKALEDKTLYKYIKTTDANGKPLNKVEYDFDSLAKDMGAANDENFRKDFRNVELGVINKIAKLIERIDGQIKQEERTMLQRDVLGRFTMTHKGWLSIVYSNRFKKKHLNLQTGQYEEGSYISLMKFFTNTLNSGYTKKGIKGSFSDFKDAYMDADSEIVRQNLRRAGIEMSFLIGMFLISLAASGWADDDDDNLTAQMTAYMLERVVNETSSSQLGIVGEFYKSFKEPVVGLGKIDNLVSLSDTYNTDLVKSGRYKGVSHQAKYFIKNIPGVKSAFDFSSAKNLKSQRDSYDYFNEEEIFTPIAWFIDEEDLKEENNNEEQN